MKGMHWVTKTGRVVEQVGSDLPDRSAWCRPAGASGPAGWRLRFDRMRPATRHEVDDAKAKAAKRGRQ